MIYDILIIQQVIKYTHTIVYIFRQDFPGALAVCCHINEDCGCVGENSHLEAASISNLAPRSFERKHGSNAEWFSVISCLKRYPSTHLCVCIRDRTRDTWRCSGDKWWRGCDDSSWKAAVEGLDTGHEGRGWENLGSPRKGNPVWTYPLKEVGQGREGKNWGYGSIRFLKLLSKTKYFHTGYRFLGRDTEGPYAIVIDVYDLK